ASGEAARKERLQYEHEGTTGEINVEAMPLYGRQKRAFLILFEPVQGAPVRAAETPPGRERGTPADNRDGQIARLKQELANARQRLLSMFEEHQVSTEES